MVVNVCECKVHVRVCEREWVGGFPPVQQLYPERGSEDVFMRERDGAGAEDIQQLLVSSQIHQKSLKCQGIRKARITLITVRHGEEPFKYIRYITHAL